jgi:hypothetical protein
MTHDQRYNAQLEFYTGTKTFIERKHRFIEKQIIKDRQDYIIIVGFGQNMVLVI